jgi:ubiquinone/menaquinone biosynthesis C-methylase UbiE
MNSYKGRHVALYDIFYSDKDYAHEASFIHTIFESQNRQEFNRILELACGTGSFALELEKFGYDITATDNSSDMIACAQKKVVKAETSVNFEVRDMR